jgi:hypothetical protein
VALLSSNAEEKCPEGEFESTGVEDVEDFAEEPRLSLSACRNVQRMGTYFECREKILGVQGVGVTTCAVVYSQQNKGIVDGKQYLDRVGRRRTNVRRVI